MSMKKSPVKPTPQKSRKKSSIKTLSQSQSRTSSSNQQPSNLYFCHFKNAMYMGGIKSFQKNGTGILIHDNGTNVISSYYNDLLHGHNIFFTDHRILSAEYYKNRITDCVYRTDGFTLFTVYNSEGLLDGRCILMNHIHKSILYCIFKKGILAQKYQQTDFTIINRVFDIGQTDFLISKKHQKALNYKFQKQNNIIYQKVGNKLVIGFQKHGLINGLSFTYSIRSQQNINNNLIQYNHKNQDHFQMILLEKGYYNNGQLNGFGQKIFKNSNSYIGQFKNDIFQGNGILKNNNKKNWVHGIFKKGNLVDLLQYNHQGGDKKYDRIVQLYHQKRSNWINNDVHLINWNFFDEEIQKLITLQPNTQVKTLQQRKMQVLKKIQQNFICNNDQTTSSNLKQIQQISAMKSSQNNTGQKQSVRRFVRNFIPENQNTTPRKYSQSSRSKQFNSNLKSSRRKQPYFFQSSNLNSIKKSRIFESKVTPSKSSDSLIKLHRVPIKQQPQQFGLSSNRPRKQTRQLQSLNRTIKQPLNSSSLLKRQSSHFPKKIFNSNNSNLNYMSPQKSQSKSNNKSRIFTNEQKYDEATAKFNYNQRDAFKFNNNKKQMKNQEEDD